MLFSKQGILVVLFFSAFTNLSAQRNYDSYNRIGVTGGITFFNIETDDLQTASESGFSAGFTTRGPIYNDFDLVYGINFTGNKVSVLGNNLLISEQILYQFQAAQLTFLGSYNIVKHHLSIEFGPILNINGKLKLEDERFSDYILEGYSILRAEEIQDISRLNFHLAGGISTGFESFKISGLYQYGVTNILNKLNDQNLENTDFNGHSSTIVIAVTFYF